MAAGALVNTKTRELAYRHNGGLHVTLLWQEREDSLFVVVLDEAAGTMLRVPARRRNALEVFRHPFAYA